MFNLHFSSSDSKLRMFHKNFSISNFFFRKGKKCLESVSGLEKSNIFNRRRCFGSVCKNRASHISKSWKLREKRYSSSLKVVKETVRKCRISQKSWCVTLCIRNFRDKNGDARKSFYFFDTQIKTPETSDYACSRESTLRGVPVLPFDAIKDPLKMLMQILY